MGSIFFPMDKSSVGKTHKSTTENTGRFYGKGLSVKNDPTLLKQRKESIS